MDKDHTFLEKTENILRRLKKLSEDEAYNKTDAQKLEALYLEIERYFDDSKLQYQLEHGWINDALYRKYSDCMNLARQLNNSGNWNPEGIAQYAQGRELLERGEEITEMIQRWYWCKL